MRQILQSLSSGETLLAELAAPPVRLSTTLVETTSTLVSLGTEKMLIDFGKGGLLAKARSQPDKVKQVLQKIKTDGLWTTIDAVKAKLDTPIPLGYCNVGVVAAAGVNSGFNTGDRVASNGPHAEVVSIPENLAAKIPDSVSDEQAAFTVVGAIGLQGIRLLQPTLGERIVVSGLGLIGLLAVQMLKANGCQVLGIDFDERKLALARQFGADTVNLGADEDPVRAAEHWTQGVGVDGVLITASAKTDSLIHQAATMCRKRGRIVLVGVIGLNLQRADFYEKELSFQVSCSYGPGRYDDSYEKRGLDYPIGFVRWTEKRNFEAVLQLLAEGKLVVDPLISHRFKFDDALRGYEAISEPDAMGILLDYGPPQGIDGPKFQDTFARQADGSWAGAESIIKTAGLVENVREEASEADSTLEAAANAEPRDSRIENLTANGAIPLPGLNRDVGVAFIGAGGFTTRMLLPLLPKAGLAKRSIASSTGVSAAYAARKFGFQQITSNTKQILADGDVDAVFVTTPHSSHAGLVVRALEAGKHVFVEKPLAMHTADVNRVADLLIERPAQCLMIGFNRRFSPHMQAFTKWLKGSPAAKSIIITVNAGAIPADHWTQDLEVGGGRIIGEACHFIDLARYLANAPLVSANATAMRSGDGRLGDCVALQLAFEDGSIATVHYLANGSKDFPKERIEVFASGRVLVCDNFRRSKELGGKHKLATRSQDKGHVTELAAFTKAIREGGAWPIPADQLIEVSQATIELAGQVSKQINASQ